jgi:hypothetical protein
MQEFSFTVQLPDWWFARRSPVYNATTWLVVRTKESSFMYRANKSLVISYKSLVLKCNYIFGGLHAGVQFYNTTT